MYWNIVDFQCFVWTEKWFSYTYTHTLFFRLLSIIDYYKILTIILCAIQEIFVACCISIFIYLKSSILFILSQINFLKYLLYISFIYIYMYTKAILLSLIKASETTSKKRKYGEIGKHKLNEMGALNMKEKKWNKLNKNKRSYNPVFF